MKKAHANSKLYSKILEVFSSHKYISTAKIQRLMQVSYFEADEHLNRLISNNLASPRVGSYPSILLRGKDKKNQAKKYVAVVENNIKNNIYTNPEDYMQ